MRGAGKEGRHGGYRGIMVSDSVSERGESVINSGMYKYIRT